MSNTEILASINSYLQQVEAAYNHSNIDTIVLSCTMQETPYLTYTLQGIKYLNDQEVYKVNTILTGGGFASVVSLNKYLVQSVEGLMHKLTKQAPADSHGGALTYNKIKKGWETLNKQATTQTQPNYTFMVSTNSVLWAAQKILKKSVQLADTPKAEQKPSKPFALEDLFAKELGLKPAQPEEPKEKWQSPAELSSAASKAAVEKLKQPQSSYSNILAGHVFKEDPILQFLRDKAAVEDELAEYTDKIKE